MMLSDSVILLLRPSGTAIAAYNAGTGRKTTSIIRNRARRVLKGLMPELFPGRHGTRTKARGGRRRTSRAPSPRRRRTSRRVG